MTLTDADLARLEALDKAATAGPWGVHNMREGEWDCDWWWVWREGVKHYAGVVEMGGDEPHEVGLAAITDHDHGEAERADAELIAEFRNRTPDLVAELREARAALARVKALCERGEEFAANWGDGPMNWSTDTIRDAIEGADLHTVGSGLAPDDVAQFAEHVVSNGQEEAVRMSDRIFRYFLAFTWTSGEEFGWGNCDFNTAHPMDREALDAARQSAATEAGIDASGITITNWIEYP